MSKLFVAVLAFSTASLALGYQSPSLGYFASNPSIKDAFPGFGNESLLNAFAALQKPVTVAKVKDVYKEHVPALYRAIEAAEAAFGKVLNGDRALPAGYGKATHFLKQVGAQVEKDLLVGSEIDERSKEGLRLLKAFKAFDARTQKVIGEKYEKAVEAVKKA
ncbi:hypothetical protein AAVH_26582 [Aphelenchoides avenae]|nr:hypothetical protein AAVH_26582 [Aphelenchus avenae]